MKRNNWPVGKYGIRPNGPQDKCFYCDAAEFIQHRVGCVIRERSVVIRTIIEHVVLVPEGWGTETIEFTEGSSCSNNKIEDLQQWLERMDAAGKCSCGMLAIEFVREATTEDEEQSQTFVAGAQS